MSKYGVFTINLERSPDRREKFSQQAKNASLDFQFFPATDGLGKSVEDFANYDRAARIKEYFFDLKTTEIACYYSHYNCIKNAYDSGFDKVAIFEDDVTFAGDFNHIMDFCFSLDERFEMVRLFGLKNKKSIKVTEIGYGYNLVIPLNVLCGAQGYILNRTAMKKILDYGKNITVQYDIMIDRFWENGLTIFAVDPYPIAEAFSADSTINLTPVVDEWRKKGNRHLRMALKLGKASHSFFKRLAILKLIFKVLSGQFRI